MEQSFAELLKKLLASRETRSSISSFSGARTVPLPEPNELYKYSLFL
jgi:hypothetical protein